MKLRKVASFTDAWIETNYTIIPSGERQVSHLLQMRGLKPNLGGNNALYQMSHLLQMRGLKRAYEAIYNAYIRRIFYRCVD